MTPELPPRAPNSGSEVPALLCNFTKYYFYFRFIASVNWNILLRAAKEVPLSFHGRAPLPAEFHCWRMKLVSALRSRNASVPPSLVVE
jgi:hypothetical protein